MRDDVYQAAAFEKRPDLALPVPMIDRSLTRFHGWLNVQNTAEFKPR